MTHFTPFDWNWPFGPPEDAIVPIPNGLAAADQQKEDIMTCKNPISSFVEERSRILHEDIPIPGTGITLHYSSNRVKGYRYPITVPASGETVPDSLKQILVKLEVAGQTLEKTLDPLPNQVVELVWDGLDHLGKPVYGTIKARVSIGYLYDAVYYGFSGSYREVGKAFAKTGEIPTGIPARQEVILWRRSDVVIHKYIDKHPIAEGGTLDVHHQISPVDTSVLYKGDGSIIRVPVIIDTIAGNGAEGENGDGGPATETA